MEIRNGPILASFRCVITIAPAKSLIKRLKKLFFGLGTWAKCPVGIDHSNK